MKPDPATDLVGSLRWIMERLDDDADELVKPAAAARHLGLSRTYLYEPWRIPGFGLKGTRHTLATWREWLDRPEAERRAEWDALPIQQRRLARGVA